MANSITSPQNDSSAKSTNTSTRRRQTASKPSAKTLHPARWEDSGPLPWPSEIASRKATQAEAESTPAPEPQRRRYPGKPYKPRDKVPASRKEWVQATHNLARYRWKLSKDPTNPTLLRAVQRCIVRVEKERHNQQMLKEAKVRAKEHRLKQQYRKLRNSITAPFSDYLSEVDTSNTRWSPPSRFAA